MNLEADRERALLALLERLATASGIPTVAAADLDAHAAGVPALAVLLTATKSPESWDVCIVLPELLRAVPGVRAVAVAPAESARLASRFGVDKYPSLVVLRDGRYTGVIEGMQDWEPFVVALSALASAEPRKPPSLRIPVVIEPAATPAARPA
jgi:hydrogenase-1 operon protein HyaE